MGTLDEDQQLPLRGNLRAKPFQQDTHWRKRKNLDNFWNPLLGYLLLRANLREK